VRLFEAGAYVGGGGSGSCLALTHDGIRASGRGQGLVERFITLLHLASVTTTATPSRLSTPFGAWLAVVTVSFLSFVLCSRCYRSSRALHSLN
jgi:hypothetical protein